MSVRPAALNFRSGQKSAKKALVQADWVVFFITLALVLFGWVVLYSASALVAEGRYGDQYYYLKKQMLWSAIGAAALVVSSRISLSFLQRYARLLYVAVAVLLGLVLVMGHEVGGAKRWLRIAGMGVQPSEFAKLGVVIFLADYLDRKQSRLNDFWGGLVPPLAWVGLILGLVALERDLGTPLLIALVSVGMLFLAGARWKHIFGMFLAGLPVLYLAVFHVPYRRQRMLAFLDPWKDAQGTGYQLVQSLLALGSGGFWGRGSGESTIKMYYLPESQTDFIFSILGEEFGFVGTFLLTVVFSILVYRCFRIALQASHWFHGLLVSGISLLIAGQVLINLAVVTGLFPTKGMPLPFISFGGSSVVAMFTAIGLALNVSRRTGTPVFAARSRR